MMSIPDPLTPIAITGGIVGNIATDILLHYAGHLEGSLAGKILKHTGLLPKSFNDKFGEVLNESLKVLFDRYPEFRITGVIDFIKDPRFAEQLLSFLLDRKTIDNEVLQRVFTERISSDPYTVLTLNRRGIEAQLIVQSFFVCYREVLLRHVELPQIFVLFEIFKQTEIVVEEIKASEGRLKDYVNELFNDRFVAPKKPNINLWESFLENCEERLDIEIRSSIGRKYIPELYVHREVENRYDEFANKSTWERKVILDKLQSDVVELEKEENALIELIDKANSKILELDIEKKNLASFLTDGQTETSKGLWRKLNSIIVYLAPIDEDISKRLDFLGDELNTFGLESLQQSGETLQHEIKLDEIHQNLLKVADKLRIKLTKQGILDSLDKKRNAEIKQISIVDSRVSGVQRIKSLLQKVQQIFFKSSGQYAYRNTESSLELIDEILGNDQAIAERLGFVSKTIILLRKHFQNCFLVIDRAGSGKTNLLCHLAKKYTRSQATIFISGRILLENEFSLEDYIIKSFCCPELNLNFSHLDQVDNFLSDCSRVDGDKKLLVFIDGINENSNTAFLKRALQKILASAQTKNILFCISCRDIFWDYFRDEFWHEHVYELAKGKLYNFTQQEFSLALNRYLSYYRIECELHDEALEKCHQPLLLRFFCEAYGSFNSETVNRGEFQEIRLKKLFDDYWERKIASTKSSLGYRTSRDIETFLYSISEYMWKNRVRNISLKTLKQITNVSDLDSDKSVYIRLLDEDIIIEEGSAPNLEPWATFVYDEFMEYSMARGIISSFSKSTSRSEVEKTIGTLIRKYEKFKNIEGVLGYLCLMFLSEQQMPIWDILISQGMPWVLVVAKSMNQLSVDEVTQTELSVLQKLSGMDDDVKCEVLRCAEKIYVNSTLDLTSIWSNLFQSSVTRFQARHHLIQASNNGNKRALNVFLDVLDNSSDDLRAFSVYSLSKIWQVEPSVIAKIADLSTDQSKLVRRAVALALQNYPGEYTRLANLLEDKYASVRKQACLSLAESDDFDIAAKLLKTYANERNKDVRDSARISLQSISSNLTKENQSLLLSELMDIEELLDMEKHNREDQDGTDYVTENASEEIDDDSNDEDDYEDNDYQ